MLNCKPTAILQRRQLSRYDLSDALVFTQWRMLVFLFSSSRHHSMRRVHSAPTASPSSGNYTANTPVGDSNNFAVEIHKINDPLLLGVCAFEATQVLDKFSWESFNVYSLLWYRRCSNIIGIKQQIWNFKMQRSFSAEQRNDGIQITSDHTSKSQGRCKQQGRRSNTTTG